MGAKIFVDRLTIAPQDAQIAIDPACSTFCYEYYGDEWQAPVSGTLDLTIAPDCTGPACTLTLTKIQLGAEDHIFHGHYISEVEIRNQNLGVGRWQDDNTIAFDKADLNLYVGFKTDFLVGGHNDINMVGLAWGTLDTAYENFTLNGDIIRGDWLTSSFSLCGHPVARPPVPVFTPSSGVFQADGPLGANITFSSEQSHDPDNDIKDREWRVNKRTIGFDRTLTTALPVGMHTIELNIMDSRMVRKSTSAAISVIDDSIH